MASSAKNDTVIVQLYINIADEYFSIRQSDSALYYYNLSLSRVRPERESNFLPQIYNRLNRFYYKGGDYSKSIDYSFKTLAYYDNIISASYDTARIDPKIANVCFELGISYYAIGNYKKALEFFEKGYQLIEPLNLNLDIPELTKRMFSLVNNMGSANSHLKNFDKARENFEIALKLNQHIGYVEYDAGLYNNLGVIFQEENNFAKAYESFYKALEIRESVGDTAGLAQVYFNIGNLEFEQGDYSTAIYHLQKAMDYGKKSGSLMSQMVSAEILSKSFEKTGKYRKGLEMFKFFKELNDSIISTGQLEQVARLELQYQHESQLKEMELRQQVELAKKEKKSLVILIIAFILLFSGVILYLVNRNQRAKIQQGNLIKERLELEQKNLNLENKNLEMELEHRNKELTTQVLYLINKNELLSSITEKLLSIKGKIVLPENQAEIKEIIHELETNIDNTVWKEFEVRFQNVQQDFYRKLHEKYPNLSANETKLCAFLKLNMTTKDISSITFQSIKSIEMARSRLRKKMGISRDHNLIKILQEL